MPIDFSQKIERVKDITNEKFQTDYFIPQKPVVIEGYLKDSPAAKKWNIEYFKENMGHIDVGVFDDGVDILDRPNNIAIDRMNFGEYLDLISKEPSKKRLFAFNMFKKNKNLRKDFIAPKLTRGILPRMEYAFFGGATSITRLHRDADNANLFLSEFEGEKMIILFDSSQDDLLYKYPFTIHSGVDIENPDYTNYPGLHYVRGMHTILKKGDTLFMPSKYWHYIRYVSPGIGVSFRAKAGFLNFIRGLNHVLFTMQFDYLMRKLLKNKWFEYKTRIAQKRANKAILKKKNE